VEETSNSKVLLKERKRFTSIYITESVSVASDPDRDRRPVSPGLTRGGELFGLTTGTAPLSKNRVACGSRISSISVFAEELFGIIINREMPL
jgi:hypothetical protein